MKTGERKKFDISWLEVFLLAVELGSYSKAAARLGLNQSSVSRIIRKLEDFVGEKLFEKKGNILAPTITGLKTQSLCAEIVQRVDELSSKTNPIKNFKNEHLRFASSYSFARALSSYVVNAMINSVRNIETFSGNTRDVVEMLNKNFIDIGVITSTMEDFNDYTAIPLYREPYLAILPNEFNGTITSRETLISYANLYPCIQFQKGTTDWQHTSRVLRQLGIRKSPLSISTIETIIKLVEEKKFWSLMPPVNIWGSNVLSSGVCFKFLSEQQGYRTAYLLVRQQRHLSLAREIASVTKICLKQFLIPRFTAIDETLGSSIEIIEETEV